MKQKCLNRTFTFSATVALWLLAAYAGDSFAAQRGAKPSKPSVKQPAVKVVELRELAQLQEAFQRDHGKVRLVMILSPT